MLECLLLLTFTGLLLASQRRMGPANPFQIYFLVWFLVFFGYYILGKSFINVSFEFLVLMFAAKAIAFLFLTVLIFVPSTHIDWRMGVALPALPKERLVLLAQIIVFCAMPLVYKRAVDLAGGDDVFTVLGYIKLRGSTTAEGEGFGFLAYFSALALVVSSLQVQSYLKKVIGLPSLAISVAISLFYVYMGTGRTFVLMFAVLMICPLIVMRIIRIKGLLVFMSLVFVAFVFVAAMTEKGISVEAGFSENIESLLDNLRGYTIAPLLALFRLTISGVAIDWGLNTFRSFVSLFHALGLTDAAPVALIKDYEVAPDPTNVYTVYEVYFRDFSYSGIIVPPLFLIVHWWLYLKARRVGGNWIFYYSASTYPLLMQFFQDQYFSLLSLWMQIGFWYWLLVKNTNKERPNNLIGYA